MSTHVTIENAVTVTLTKPQPKFIGGPASIYWHTLDELAEVGEIWTNGESVRIALVTRAFANKVDPVTQRYLTDENRDHILTQKTLCKSDRCAARGLFFGPWRVDFPKADPEQEVGGLLAYSAVTGRLLFFVRANSEAFTGNQLIRTVFASGIYAQVRA